MTETGRDRILTVCAVLFGVLALSNFLKPLQLEGAQTGFVLFGTRLSGTANAVAGPLFGLYLATYAAGIWRTKRYALPMGQVYAAYVVLNLILFNVRNPVPPGAAYLVFGIVYSTVAIGVSLGAAILLAKCKAALT